jgi:protein phosphatase
MGTTATVALLASDKVFVGHVGDSRAYRVQNGELTCLTVDHTWVQGEVEAGRMTAEQAAIHPRRNVLTRALGTGPFVRVDRTLYSIDVGDMLILCTDGLLKVVSEAEMLIYARNVWDPQEVCDTLVSLSNYRGGPDNISVIVARVTAEAEQLKIEADTQIITPVKQDPTPRKPNSSILSKFRLRG